MLNIDAEQARIKEHRKFARKVRGIFEDTEYENQIDKILQFVEEQDTKSLKFLYTGSLHEFGREDGRVIYQKLKNVV